MGFLGEIRKLLFGVKSVSKSAGRKAVEKGKDIGEDFMEKSSDFFDDVKETASDIGENISGRISKMKDKTDAPTASEQSKFGEMTEKASDSAKAFGKKIAESPAVEKAAEISEKVGEKVLDAGEKMMDKGMDISEKVGEKVLQAKDKIVERAKEITADLSDKLDRTIEKAQKEAEAEKAKPKSEFAEDTLDASGSLLEGQDDFFSKASRFADGDHHSFSEGKIEITHPGNETPKAIKAAGFEDLDGDGDEIADDAIIISEEE